MNTTARLGLKLIDTPAVDTVDQLRVSINTNAEIVDTLYTETVAASRPAAATLGRVHRATDTKAVSVDLGGGNGWTTIVPGLVTALPASPVTGDRIVLQNSGMATAKVRWALAYKSGSGWEFEGGLPLLSKETSTTTSSTSTLALIANGPAVTVPFDGTYRIEAAAMAAGTGSGAVTLALRKDSTTIEQVGGINPTISWQPWLIETVLTAGQVLAIWGKNSAGDLTAYSNRAIKLTPVAL